MPVDDASDDADHALGSTEQLLAAAHREVFDALDEAFCVIEMILDEHGDPIDYRFLDVNAAFEHHSGVADVRGKTISDVVPRIERRWIATFGRVARSRTSRRFEDEVGQLRRRFDVYAWPFGRPESQRVAIHFTDVTHRQQAEDELFNRGRQFHTLVQKAPIGVTVVDADLRIVEANPSALQMFGDVTDPIGRDYEAFLHEVWPQELAAEVAELTRRMIVTGDSHYEPELSVLHEDRGITDYYDWRMERIRLPDGLHGVVCYFTDCSKQVLSRHELTTLENRYRTLFKTIEEGFAIFEVVFDDQERPIDYRFADVNAAFTRHSGIEEPLGRTITELMPDIEPFWLEAFEAVVLTGKPTRLQARLESLGRWFDVYAFLIEEHDERKVAILFNDVTKQKRAEYALQESVALLRYHAHHDALTGLPNRLRFEERLHEVVATADRHGRPFAVLFLDLDAFKAVNDDFGHSCGDLVLIEIARRLRRSLRASDFLARLHGDEFVLILPEMDEQHQAGSMAQKLLGIVSDPITVTDTTVTVQASIGISMYPNDGTDARALLRAADTAMYAAKQGGKNGVSYVVAPPEGEGT